MSAKPSPPKLNRDGLEEFRSRTNGREILVQLTSRLEELDMEHRDDKLPLTYIALDALGAFVGCRLEGYSDEELRATWPKNWGTEEISVPLVLLVALRDAWFDYKVAPIGKTLGESFHMEGLGARGVKGRKQTRDKRKGLSNRVLNEYICAEGEISLEDAIAIVAESQGVAFKTVEKAYQECGPETRKRLARFGIIDTH